MKFIDFLGEKVTFQLRAEERIGVSQTKACVCVGGKSLYQTEGVAQMRALSVAERVL